MSVKVTIDQAATQLPELIHALGPADEILLIENDRVVAKIVVPPSESPQSPKPRRQLGALKGQLIIVSDDDEHLEDFKDYM